MGSEMCIRDRVEAFCESCAASCPVLVEAFCESYAASCPVLVEALCESCAASCPVLVRLSVRAVRPPALSWRRLSVRAVRPLFPTHLKACSVSGDLCQHCGAQQHAFFLFRNNEGAAQSVRKTSHESPVAAEAPAQQHRAQGSRHRLLHRFHDVPRAVLQGGGG